MLDDSYLQLEREQQNDKNLSDSPGSPPAACARGASPRTCPTCHRCTWSHSAPDFSRPSTAKSIS